MDELVAFVIALLESIQKVLILFVKAVDLLFVCSGLDDKLGALS